MVIKYRMFPIKILILRALLRRLPHNHLCRKLIEEELAKSYAGYRGEQFLDHYLKHYCFQEYLIFQDIRLPISPDTNFQIDFLLLSQSNFLILEVKNITGTLYFDNHQLTRTISGQTESFPDPILQVTNQQHNLQLLMEKYSFPTIPNSSFVVVTNSSSIININPDYPEAVEKVIRPAALRLNGEAFHQQHQDVKLTKKELQNLSQLLIKLDTPDDTDILKKFKIDICDIIPGVQCDHCQRFSVSKVYNKWVCANCSKLSNKAFIQALLDYRLLVSPYITNSQCKAFLQLPTSSITNKVLSSLQLSHNGKYRYRKYDLPIKALQQKLLTK